ncbi:MAG TPA: tripartite tricarboxylate transporter substrate binding protein [Pseudorhodoferax sp.]|jgi:tripartite-type tricarboxylate transporter receptor subunit TctC|nr:tripartite tricarboxylate transporter substrate binding protein [Pseudorhodoferax sp.]
MAFFLSRRRAALGALLGLSAALALAPGGPAAAQTWPDKPIRLVVGFAPGGFTDVLARLLGQQLSQRLGQPVVVENKPGAAGTLGADLVAKSKPDGYTLLLGHSNSNSVAPALYPRLPYDVIRDFTPITRIATTPLLLTVHPSVAATDVKAFVALAKSKPEGLRFASSGSGSAQHLAAARFMLATGTQMVHVPYKGSGSAIVDLLAGHIELNFESPPNILPHWQSGKLRVLAITSNKRSPLMPDVPTLAEAGVPNAEMLQWFALLGPAGLPAEVTRRINTEVTAILKLPEVVEKIASQGGEIVAGTPEQFAAFLPADVASWAQLVKQANVRID